MLERFLDQIGEVLRLCEDTDGILVVNREGIIEYHRIPLNSYWCSQDTVGRHILELYPELDGESSTILTALRTGRASYDVLQDINNHRGSGCCWSPPPSPSWWTAGWSAWWTRPSTTPLTSG